MSLGDHLWCVSFNTAKNTYGHVANAVMYTHASTHARTRSRGVAETYVHQPATHHCGRPLLVLRHTLALIHPIRTPEGRLRPRCSALRLRGGWPCGRRTGWSGRHRSGGWWVEVPRRFGGDHNVLRRIPFSVAVPPDTKVAPRAHAVGKCVAERLPRELGLPLCLDAREHWIAGSLAVLI